jgi:hypothetical protein
MRNVLATDPAPQIGTNELLIRINLQIKILLFFNFKGLQEAKNQFCDKFLAY